nr:unnamed protein product [Callosobruchus chinensis]
MMKTRDKAYSKFKRTRNEAHWNFYRELKNYVNRAIEVEKKAYLDFALRQKDSRNIWRRLRNLNVLNSNNSEVPCDLFDKNDISSHFVQLPVITKNAQQLNLLNKYNSKAVNAEFCFIPIETSDTIKYLFTQNDWSFLDGEICSDDKFSFFHDIFLELMDKAFPTVYYPVNRNSKRKPGLSKEILEQGRLLREIHAACKYTMSIELLERYKTLKASHRLKIQVAKKL